MVVYICDTPDEAENIYKINSDFNPPTKKKRVKHSNVRLFDSKGTQTDPVHPVLSLLDGLKLSQPFISNPIGFVQSFQVQKDNTIGVLNEFMISIKCSQRPPFFSRFKDAITNMYFIHITLATMYGLAPDILSLPLDNPVISHLSDPSNRANLFTCSEIENVINGLATFDWYNYRQIIILLQEFLIEKIFKILFQTVGELYQVRQSPSHFVKILTYDSSSVINEHLQTVLKAQSYVSGRFREMNHNLLAISYKCEELSQNSISELSLKYIFVVSPYGHSSKHNLLIKEYRNLFTPSTSGLH